MFNYQVQNNNSAKVNNISLMIEVVINCNNIARMKKQDNNSFQFIFMMKDKYRTGLSLWIGILALIVFNACTPDEKEVTIPEGLIPRDTLLPLLVDIHLADAYLSQNRLPKKSKNRNVFYAGITRKYGYERAVFDSTIRFLATQPKLYQDIYEEVINELSMIKGQVEKEKQLDEKYGDEQENFSYSHETTNLNENKGQVNDDDSVSIKKFREAQKRFEQVRKNRKSRMKNK